MMEVVLMKKYLKKNVGSLIFAIVFAIAYAGAFVGISLLLQEIIDIIHIDVRNLRNMDKSNFPIRQINKRAKLRDAGNLTFHHAANFN